MRVRSRALAVCLGAAVLPISIGVAAAAEVGGGGSKATDCLSTFVAPVNVPAASPSHVNCTDGDPACDADMVVNGVCAVPLSVCADSTFSSLCGLNGVASITVDHALDDGVDPKFDPNLQALQSRIDMQIDLTDDSGMQAADQCTTATTIGVPIKGPFGSKCAPGLKLVRVRTVSKPISGKVYKDIDAIRIKCLPSASNGCDAQTLFDGTFDRIQRQVFNQSCAVPTCHDSESQRGGLLLETGASYTDLVNATPINGGAFMAGWKRVEAAMVGTAGDPDTSYLYHKLTGALPNTTYGGRMPLKRPKLNKSLIEVVRLWILGGAPETGWVAGTF